MERTDILPPINALDLTKLDILSKYPIIISNKENPPSIPFLLPLV